MTENDNISVIIPAYNEELTIGSMVTLAKKYAPRVIVVDDGSADRTSEIAAASGAEVIRHAANRGKGYALKSGFEAAKGSTILVTMDADGQHDPREIPGLVEPVLRGEADIVIGSRYLEGRDHTPRHRRAGQKILDLVTSIETDMKLTDTQSGFRAFHSRVFPVFRFAEGGFAIESEMLRDASDAGLRIREVPIGVRYDVDGSTLNPIHHGALVFLKLLHNIEYKRPLFYFFIPGIVLTFAGLGIGVYFLQLYVEGRGALPFGPTILMAIFTLTGVYLTFTGIILHTMANLFKMYK